MDLDFSFLNWDVLTGFVLKGLVFSVQLTLIAMIGGIVLGTLLALMRLSGKPWLEKPASFYVNTMRSIPLVMVILWFFLLIPLMIGKPMGAEASAIVTFTLFEAAYYSEIMRAGMDSIHKGQLEAAECLALTRRQVYWHVVLRPAMEKVYPALTSQFVLLMLATSITSQISVEELTAIAARVQSETFRPFEAYILVALAYLLLSLLMRLGLWLFGQLIFTRKRKLAAAGGTR